MVILHQGFGFVIRQFDGVAGKSLLDYGYGNGNLCRLASETGMEVAGIEPDEAARKQASTKISNNEVFAHLSGLQRAHPNCQFDLICLSESIQHLRNPWTAAIRLERSGTTTIGTSMSSVLFLNNSFIPRLVLSFTSRLRPTEPSRRERLQLRVDDDDWGFVLA